MIIASSETIQEVQKEENRASTEIILEVDLFLILNAQIKQK